MEEAIKKADVLIEALPYIKKFRRKIVVIKYGGSILGEERLRSSILEDVVFLRYMGLYPILVHGGGPNITERMRELRISTEFIEGMRVTDKRTLEIVEEELNKLNDVIVKEISSHNVKGIGIKREDKIIFAQKKKSVRDLGFVGEIVKVDVKKIKEAVEKGIPVVCPMGTSEEGVAYNINADEVASFLSYQVGAEKLVLLTNVLGVMRNSQDENSLISTLTVSAGEEFIKEKVIQEGMIPKVKAAIEAIKNNVRKAHIIDAKIPHALLLEIFTDEGIGTEIVEDKYIHGEKE